MAVKLILAVDQDNTIGWSDGRLPWHIPEDLNRFKDLTTGRTVFMGFNTFKSLNRPKGLSNRRNVVLSKKSFEEIAPLCGVDPEKLQASLSPFKRWAHLPIDVANSFDWVTAHQTVIGKEPEDLWVIGGAEVYNHFLDADEALFDEIYLTRVHQRTGADVAINLHLYQWAGEEKHFVWQRTEFIEREGYDFSVFKLNQK